MKIKLIKKAERDSPVVPAKPEETVNPKEWSSAVKSWVREFQEDRKDAPTPAFDTLFDDGAP